MEIIILVKSVLKKWWLLVLSVVFSAALSYFFTSNMNKEYKSVAQIATGFTVENNLMDNSGINYRSINVKFSNLIANFKSKLIYNLTLCRLLEYELTSESPFSKEAILSQLDSASRNYFIGKLRFRLTNRSNSTIVNVRDDELTDLATQLGYSFEKLTDAIKIRRIEGTDYVSIEVTSNDPNLSAYLANAICEEFIMYENEINKTTETSILKIYEKRYNDKEDDIEEKRKQLELFKIQNNLVNVELENQTRFSSISNYELSKIEEEKKLNALTYNIEQIKRRLVSISGDGSNDTGIDNSELVKIKVKIVDLNSRYIDSGMKDVELLDSLNTLRTLYNEIKNKAIQSMANDPNALTKGELIDQKIQLETDYQITKANLDVINRNLNYQKSVATKIAGKDAEYNDLKSDLEVLENERREILSDWNSAKSQAQTSNLSLKQTLFGQPSTEAEPSKRPIIIILASLASFFFVVMIIVTIELLDLSFKNEERFNQMTRLSTSGIVNEINLKTDQLDKIFKKNFSTKDVSQFRQNIRKIRLEILNSGKKTILFTSTKERSGKSYLIISLAYSLGLINKRVLIIDTNFKSNDLTKILLLQKKNVDVVQKKLKLLSYDTTLNYSYENNGFIYQTDYPGIDFIGSHMIENSPSEIFSGKDFNSFIELLKNSYDFIFLEGPALNNFPDSKELTFFCDGVLPVFSADFILSQSDKISIKYLSSLNGKLLDPILNKVNP